MVTKDGITKTVKDILIESHPIAESTCVAYAVTEKQKLFPYVVLIFEKLNVRYTRKAAMKTSGNHALHKNDGV